MSAARPGRRIWRSATIRPESAIGYQLERLAAHGLKACFFVDPMPALVYGIEPIRRMVEPILAAGQEVQLHLHPSWADPAEPVFELTGLDRRDAARADPHRPRPAGRGRSAAARSPSAPAAMPPTSATLEALAALGIRYDSSHNGSHHPDPSALPLDPRRIAPALLAGVVEIPVTQIEQRPGSLRHLQICAVSFDEMRAALLHAADHGHPVVNHRRPQLRARRRAAASGPIRSSSAASRDCAASSPGKRERLPTAHFSDLADLPLDAEASPLRSGAAAHRRPDGPASLGQCGVRTGALTAGHSVTRELVSGSSSPPARRLVAGCCNQFGMTEPTRLNGPSTALL